MSSGDGSPLSGSYKVFLPGWNLSDQADAHEWCRHAFPPATFESLDLLSYSYMVDELQFTVAQVAPYLLVAAGLLRYIGANLAKSTVVEADRDKFMDRASFLE